MRLNPLHHWKMEDTIKWIDNKKKQFSVYKGAGREGNESVSDDDDTDALEVFPQWTVTCSPKNYQTCLLSTSSSSSAALKIIVYNAGCSVYCMIVFMPTRCTLIPKEDVAKTTLIFPSGCPTTHILIVFSSTRMKHTNKSVSYDLVSTSRKIGSIMRKWEYKSTAHMFKDWQ